MNYLCGRGPTKKEKQGKGGTMGKGNKLSEIEEMYLRYLGRYQPHAAPPLLNISNPNCCDHSPNLPGVYEKEIVD